MYLISPKILEKMFSELGLEGLLNSPEYEVKGRHSQKEDQHVQRHLRLGKMGALAGGSPHMF